MLSYLKFLCCALILFFVAVTVNAQTGILVFKDTAFTAMPEYNADDVMKLFSKSNVGITQVDHKQLESLDSDTKLLIIPYLKGNFSEKALNSIISFHENGGGLFFLGDLPNKDKWYPLRNMQSSDFHLTRGYGNIQVEGLTAKGIEIINSLTDPGYFQGKYVPSISVTAYPPDKTYNLIHNNSDAWALLPVIAVERKGEKFFGARLCVYGFNGGEPRENVDGAYQMEWQRNPGMLTRDWKGCDSIVMRMAEWILETPDIAGVINIINVHKADKSHRISVCIRNLSDRSHKIENIRLIDVEENKELFFQKGIEIEGKQDSVIIELLSPEIFGAYHYQFVVDINGKAMVLDNATEYILPDDAAEFPGFGYSTYWAFREPRISEPYKYFSRQMKKLGLQYMRTSIPWEDVEPEPGKYDWRIPDDIANFAEEENIQLAFWMFATTRGSGLGDGGVPWWSLREPAIDRYGNKGFHPTLWSPFYREHYFGMIDEFTRRFANSKMLKKFVLDFGNSDFPYGYHYYVNPPDLFDYSVFERRAFSDYLRNNLNYNLEDISMLYTRHFEDWDDVYIPFAEETEPWRIYLNFRRWSVQQGMQKVAEICRINAPEKLASDLPGHGLGSISDLNAGWFDVKARHWNEEKKFDRKYTELHNSGPEWGGEPWQVGGGYKEFDDALYGSLRFNANYFTIPAPDFSIDTEGLAKVGFIRRTIMGAEQSPARIAIIDMMGWNNFQSSCNVGARMDQRVDFLGFAHRFDFSCYDLLVLPDDEMIASVGTVATSGSLLPTDEHWYWLLRESVEKGLTIVVFPNTCVPGRTKVQSCFLREVFELDDVSYGERTHRKVKFPDNFGGGSTTGHAVTVNSEGEVLLTDTNNEPILVKRKFGKGAIIIAGWDNSEDSFDGKLNYFEQERINKHTLVRLAEALQINPECIGSGQLNIYKSLLRRENKEYLILFSHLKHEVVQEFRVKLNNPSSEAYDLASGKIYPVKAIGDNWYTVKLSVLPRSGVYLSFHD